MPDEPTNPGAPPAPSPSATPARPSWLPEGFNTPEELAGRWAETSKRLKEMEPALELAKRWERWGDPDQFERNLAARLAERDKKQRAEWEKEQQTRQPATQQTNPFDNWELMDPQAQAATQAAYVTQQVLGEVQKAIEGYWQQGRNQLNEYDQRFQLLARALTDRTSNPDLDLNQLWSEANNLATGDPSKLYGLAYERATLPNRIKKEVEAAVAAERQRLEQEYQNKLNAALTGPGSGQTATSFKDFVKARESGKEGIRNRVMQKGLQEGWLVPGQL